MVFEFFLLTLTVLSSFPAYIGQTVTPLQQHEAITGEKTAALPQAMVVLLTATRLDATPTIAPLNTPTPTKLPTPKPKTPKPSATPTLKPTAALTTPAPTVAPTPISTVTPQPTPTDLNALFTKYGDEYKVDKEQLKRIAVCESKLNTNAGNKWYAGLYQFGEGSWAAIRKELGQNTDIALRKNPEEAVRTAAFVLSKGRANIWPNCK